MRVRLYLHKDGKYRYWKTITGTFNTQFFSGFLITMLSVYSDRVEVYLKKEGEK